MRSLNGRNFVAAFVIVVGNRYLENWEIGRNNGLWATPTRVNVSTDDDLFFWKAKTGLVAHAVATTDVSAVDPAEELPWPDHKIQPYKWKFGMRLVDEPPSPVERRWANMQERLGSGTAANKAGIRIDANRVEAFIALFSELDQPAPNEASGPKRRLSDISDPGAVEAAIAEFLDLGREPFLEKHNMQPSRDFFVNVDGKLVDSKPILAVAHSYQYPHFGLLPVSGFSGGSGGAVRALARLGFSTVTRAQIQPPQLTDTYPSRTAVYEAFGGDKVAGIIRFPGDTVVNIFSDADGPYSDDPPSLLNPFGYRGEGLSGAQRLQQGGNALLEAARVGRTPVRFWYRPRGGQFSFLAFALVLGRAWVDGIGSDGVPRPEIDWQLSAIPGENGQIPTALNALLDEAEAATEDSPIPPEAKPGSTYLDLLNRVEALGNAKRPTGVVRTNYQRSAAARGAVLLRANGRCESERCTGMPAELNRQGEPIMDVDHITDLALGGEDHPRNMVALCPNCHACKTRGTNARRWRAELAKVAERAHERAIRGTDPVNLYETDEERILQTG